MRRFLQLFSMAFFLAFVPGAHAADAPVCSTLLYDDAEMMKALPDRLRPIVESARFHTILANRDAAWSNFHGALDRAFANPGKRVIGTIGEVRALMYFKRSKLLGEYTLWIDVVAKGRLAIGETSLGGFEFLDFVAAELGWIAKARAAGKLKNLAIVGKDLEHARLADTLASLGFKPSRWPGPRCYIVGVIGGLVGYGAGRVYFQHVDNDVENGSIYEDQRKFYRDIAAGALLGTGSAVALACFRKTGRNYSIEFNPDEIVKNPKDRPPGDIPPIDEPVPGTTDPVPPVVVKDPVPTDPVPPVKEDPIPVPAH